MRSQLVELGVDAVADRRRRRARAPAARRAASRSSSSRKSARSSSSAARLRMSGACRSLEQHARRAGWRPATAAATRGRADRRCRAPRGRRAARGRARPSARRGICRVRCCGTRVPRRASSRSWIRSSASSGRSSQVRSSRPPIGRERAIDFVEQRSVRGRHRPLRSTSRLLSVIGSMTIASAPVRNVIVADVRQIGLLRLAQVLHERAGGARRRAMIFEPEALRATARSHLSEQRARARLRTRTSRRRAAVTRVSQAQLVHERGNIVERRRGARISRGRRTASSSASA